MLWVALLVIANGTLQSRGAAGTVAATVPTSAAGQSAVPPKPATGNLLSGKGPWRYEATKLHRLTFATC